MSQPEFAFVRAKGRFVIPAQIRSRLGIEPGTKIALIEEDGHLLLQPITDSFIESMRGSLAKQVEKQYRRQLSLEHRRRSSPKGTAQDDMPLSSFRGPIPEPQA